MKVKDLLDTEHILKNHPQRVGVLASLASFKTPVSNVTACVHDWMARKTDYVLHNTQEEIEACEFVTTIQKRRELGPEEKRKLRKLKKEKQGKYKKKAMEAKPATESQLRWIKKEAPRLLKEDLNRWEASIILENVFKK